MNDRILARIKLNQTESIVEFISRGKVLAYYKAKTLKDAQRIAKALFPKAEVIVERNARIS